MLKTILVPTSGSGTDDAVHATALGLARPLAAHLEFYHVRLTPDEAAGRTPYIGLCVDSALPAALQNLDETQRALATDAARHVHTFCERQGIPVRNAPGLETSVSASWRQEVDHPESRLLLHARHCDLVVLGRRRHPDLLPRTLIEHLLLGCGRPIVIAADTVPASVTDTIVVGWKETPEAARALTAAMPLLALARQVYLVGIAEADASLIQSLEHLAWQLAWHGIAAQTRIIGGPAHRAAEELPKAAAELKAGLLVVGGFGRGPISEFVFGGVTRSLIDRADLPVFILH